MAIQRLSRIYVGQNSALSLESWLNAIDANPQLFAAPPDPHQLKQDLNFVTGDAFVKRLIALRGNIVAHTNWNNISQNLRLGGRFALTVGEVDLLINRALEILNRYSVLFKRVHWTTVIAGHDDFKNILIALRYDLERRRAQIDQDILHVRGAESSSHRRFRTAAIHLGRYLGNLQRRLTEKVC